MSPTDLAINTVRGKAMEAVILYALWCGRQAGEGAPGSPSRTYLDALPEVVEVLDAHLDPVEDPSEAVHSVYGLFLPHLVHLGEEWVSRHLDLIFPKAPQYASRRQAAWNAYVKFNRPYGNVVRVLHEEYIASLTAMALRPHRDKGPDRAESALADHIMSLYLGGYQDLEGDLLQAFYANADARLRAHATQWLGTVKIDESMVLDEVGARVLNLWASRLAVLEGSGEDRGADEELRAFGWVFRLGHLEAGRALELLGRTVRAAQGPLEWEKGVSERLADMALPHPLECARILRAMILPDRDRWALWGIKQHSRAILEAALSSGDEAAGVARECIHRFGELGVDEFEDLLG